MNPSSPAYFPAFLNLQSRPVLIIGAGEIALRKIRLLLPTGARIRVVAQTLHADVQALADEGRIAALGATFEEAQLLGCALVIAATDDHALNQRVAEAAKVQNIPVNVVDDAELSSFITPAIINRAPVQIAISTGGSGPVLARRLREKLETILPANYGRIAEFMDRMRERVKGVQNKDERRGIWEDFVDGAGAERALQGDEVGAELELQRIISGDARRGEVYLVGAGPGDPDLLTFRALRLMQQCDVVLYDRLVSPAIMELVRRDAERVFVGKQRNQHTVPQDEINLELVRLAQQGKRVLRLKGGDPFIFGRGGEEIETLAEHGIAFQVVPGVTAASGCAAYAGIPLTHRDYAQACIFVTGHARADGQLALNWEMLAKKGQTVVIYMGLHTLPNLCQQLMAHGLPADWPAALIEEGTTSKQRVIAATLGTLSQQVSAADVKGASLVIVGEVVKLRGRLQWFGKEATTKTN
jgi:uroporphyrin-III C-methyltransferase/precorrin-2 dehydrogenase/sirohydrochlorin ferrochelatase